MVSDRPEAAVEVRSFTPSDRSALEAMYRSFEPKRGAQGLPPAEPRAITRWLDRILASGIHFLALLDGRVVGHLMLVPMNGDSWELANFVHQSARNRGIGTTLNRTAVEEAGRRGARRVWLSVEPSNRAALRSYARAGFRPLPGSLWAPEIEMEVAFEHEP